jgi:class 3 adenylate cyclase/HAMP domain-containing protein
VTTPAEPRLTFTPEERPPAVIRPARPRFSIGLRMALGTVALLAAVLTTLAVSWVTSESRLVRRLQRNEAASFAVAMAGAWSNELIDGNWNQIRGQFRAVARESDEFVYLLVTDERRDGRIVASFPEDLIGRYVPDVVPLEVSTRARSTEEGPRLSETFLLRDVEHAGTRRGLRGERIIDVAADIVFEHRRVGVLRVGISLRAMAAARRRVLRNAGIVGVLALLAGMLGAFALSRQITRPIRELEESAARMASGDLAHRSSIARPDEVGLLAGAFNRMADALDRSFHRLRGTLRSFERFVPRKFLGVIAPDGIEKIQVGNHATRTITILFSDIRGYTSISESSSAIEMFELLNEYLGEMGEAIDAHGGFIDKYIGDAIMALFDDPNPDGALRAALAMRARLEAFNARRVQAGKAPIDIGIGLHRGEVVMGAVGFAARIDSTVIGDAVNLASRVEGLTKQYGAAILVTDGVKRALRDPSAFELRVVDEAAKVKGKDEAVVLYALEP